MTERDEKSLFDKTVSRRNLLKGVGVGGAAAIFANALGVTAAGAAPAGDDPLTILSLGATAEGLAITAFYSIITKSSFYSKLTPVYQNYLKSALAQEQTHYDLWVANGGKPLTNQFFFPAGILDSLALYVYTTDVLEGTFVGAYLAAIRRFAELGRPDLSWTVASVMGIEAEHKALNRAMGIDQAHSAAANDGIQNSPTREPYEAATLYQVSQVAPTVGPILMGGVAPASAGPLLAGVNFSVGPVTQPDRATALSVANPLTNTPVPFQAFSFANKHQLKTK